MTTIFQEMTTTTNLTTIFETQLDIVRHPIMSQIQRSALNLCPLKFYEIGAFQSSRSLSLRQKAAHKAAFLRYKRGMRSRFVIAQRFRSELIYTLKGIIIRLNGIFIPYMV